MSIQDLSAALPRQQKQESGSAPCFSPGRGSGGNISVTNRHRGRRPARLLFVRYAGIDICGRPRLARVFMSVCAMRSGAVILKTAVGLFFD
jgi:hypothetical protein